jgi:drug/metabolite transporter (DMT)-like permease
MPARKRSVRFKSYAFMLVNAICWGAALIVVKPAFDVTTPFRFLLYRYLIAGLISLPLLFHYLPKIKKPAKAIKTIIPLELLGTTLTLSLLYFGLARTSAIEASMLATTAPIFVTLFGILLLKEREEKHEWIGLGLAFIGTMLLTVLPIFYGSTQFNRISIDGNLFVIGQNIATALYFVLAKKYYKKLPKLFVTTISFYVGLATFFALSVWEAGNLAILFQSIAADFQFPSVWIASIYMATFGSIIGLTAYIKGQDGIEASEAALFTYLEPLVYIPLGIFLLLETVYPIQFISLALIILGVFVAEKRKH